MENNRFPLLAAASFGLAAYLSGGFANAKPKPLIAMTEMDRIAMEYQFSPGVRWCTEQMMMVFGMVGDRTTIDINPVGGTVTFDVVEAARTVVCEPRGMRTIKDGVEEFTKFPGLR